LKYFITYYLAKVVFLSEISLTYFEYLFVMANIIFDPVGDVDRSTIKSSDSIINN